MERDRTLEILSGFKDHKSTLWTDFKNLVKKGAINYVDFVNGKTDEAKAAFQREGIKVDEKDFGDLISDNRKAVVQGSPSTGDPNAVTQFSSAADFDMASGSGVPGNSATNQPVPQVGVESPGEIEITAAGAENPLTDTTPAFSQDEPANEGKVVFEYNPGGEMDKALSIVQNTLYSIEGGKYLPEGEDPNGDGIYGDNTKKAIEQFFADRGQKVDGSKLTERQFNEIIAEKEWVK